MKPQAPKHRKRGGRGRSSGRHVPKPERSEVEEPPSVMSIPGYDESGVYLGPAWFSRAETYASPQARIMRKRLRRGALKGKAEDGDEDMDAGQDVAFRRSPRDSLPKEGMSRRGDVQLLEVGQVYGNSPQAGMPIPEVPEPGRRSRSLPRDPNARTSSPSSPLGTLEPPRAHRLLERLGASAPQEEVPEPILPLPETSEEEEAAGPKSPDKASDPRIPETLYAPKTVEELEELMLEWSKIPEDCQEGDFCYARAITAYELVPHRRPEQEDQSWVVVGRSGLMYCNAAGIEDWVNYKDFFAERELYRQMKSLRWAKRFQVSKCFAHWSENARRAGFAAARNKLEDELFQLKATSQEALLWLHGFCVEKFQRLSALDADAMGNQRCRLLAEYGAIHQMGCERLLAYVASLDQQLESGLQKWCAKMLRSQIEAERQAAERAPPDLPQLLSEAQTQDFYMPVPLVERSEAEVALGFPPTTVAGRARLQRVCLSIWNFIRLCAYMVEGHLREAARRDFQRFAAALLSRPRDFFRSTEWRSSRSTEPMRQRISAHRRELRDLVFQLELTTSVDLRLWPRRARGAKGTLPRLAATPGTEDILRWILQAISSNINSLQSLRMPSCCRSLLLYRQVATANGLAESHSESQCWPCYELSRDILDEEPSQEALMALLERLNLASEVLKSIEEQLQVLVQNYCDALTLTLEAEPLEELASQMLALGETIQAVKEIQEVHTVQGILILECVTLKKDLHGGCQDRLQELVHRSQEEIEASSRPVCDWLREHQQLVDAAPPTDIEIFLQYLLRIQKIQEEFPRCQAKVQRMRRVEVLSRDIGAQLDSFYRDMIWNAKAQVDQFGKSLSASLQRIQDASEVFVAQLQKEKPRILQKLQSFIEQVQDDEFRTLRSEHFGDLEADDMAPSKALMLAEHRGEDLTFRFKDDVESECILSRKEVLETKSKEIKELQVTVDSWTRKMCALGCEENECQEKVLEAQSLLEPLVELWSAAAEFLKVLRVCGDAQVASLQEDWCLARCKEMGEELEDMLPICLCTELQTRCEILREILQLASIFKGDDLQEMHWNQLETAVDQWNLKTVQEIRQRLNGSKLTLEELVQLDLLLIRHPLLDVYQQAMQQKELRQELEALQKHWSNARLRVERRAKVARQEEAKVDEEPKARRASFSLVDARAVYEGLANGEALLQDLEESLVKVAVLLSKADSSGQLVMELLDQVMTWHKDLVLMQDILQDWLRLQNLKSELKLVYALPEVRDLKVLEASELNMIEGWWQDLMGFVESTRLMTKVLLKANFHQEILRKISDLDRLKNNMAGLFVKKRHQCPRLYFLVDSDILELMRQAHDKVIVDANGHVLTKEKSGAALSVMRETCFLRLDIHKCFDGMEQLQTRAGLDETLCGMSSWENEVVSFGRLKMLTKVEALISLVQDAMCKTLRSQLARATMHRETRREDSKSGSGSGAVTSRVTQEGFDRLEWAQDTRFCVQSILLCEQIYWCKAVEQALMTGDHAERELRNMRHAEAGHLMRLLDVLKGDELPLQRLRLERLALQILRCQDGLRQLLAASNGPMTLDMLAWRLQLRLENPAALRQLRLRQMDYCAEYGFEYQGVCSRMVLTPQTDRCWLIITQAFAEGHVASVHGAAGLGKSETVKDLSLEAGVYCPTLRCSAFTTAEDISRVLVGLASHVSCWLCLDGVQTLSLKSYSLLLGLFFKLRALISAQEEKKDYDLFFEGQRVKPRRTPLALLLCTTDPPRNVAKSYAEVVRPVALLPPDLHRIVESQLILKGFQEEVITHCARRVVEFFRHARSFSSTPVTMHFLRTAIETAADLKASVHDLDVAAEEAVLHRAFSQVCLQYLGPADQPVLRQLLQELFSAQHRQQPTKGGWFDGGRRLSTRRASFFQEVSDGSSSSDGDASRRSAELGYRAHSTMYLEEEEEEEEESEEDELRSEPRSLRSSEAADCDAEPTQQAEEAEMTQWMGLLSQELQRRGMSTSSSYMSIFRQLRLAMRSFPGTILCGPSGVGKSTMLRCMMQAEKAICAMKDLVPPEMVQCFPGALPPENMGSGGYEAMRGSLLSKLLSSCHHKVLCFDGVLDAWAESLHGVLDRTGHRQLSNMTLALEAESRLIFETESLASTSPSTVCRCCTVPLPTEAVGPRRMLQCWYQQLPHRFPWLPPAAQKELIRLLDLFPEAVALQRTSTTKTTAPPIAEATSHQALLLCGTLTQLLEAQLRSEPRQSVQVLPGQLATGRRLSTSASIVMSSSKKDSFMARSTHQGMRAAGTLTFDYVRYAQSCYVFCLAWTLCVGPLGVSLQVLHTWLQGKIPDFQLPRGCHRLTDVYVDWSVQDIEGFYLSPWFTQLPALNHELRQDAADGFDGSNASSEAVVTLHGMSFAFVAMKLLMEGSHVLLSGPPAAGKSFTASSATRSLRTLQKWSTIGAVWSRLTSLHQCRSTLNLCAARRRPGRHLVVGEVMLHVEDLNLPLLKEPHEALRAFLDAEVSVNGQSEELSIPSAQGIRVLATTAPLHALELRGCGPPWAPRLRRHFNELQVPEPAEEDVKKILQSISRHVLKVGGGCDALEAAFSGLAEEPVSGLKLKAEDALASATLQLFKLVKEQMKATPSSGCNFSLRHLGQIMEGVARACPWHYNSRRQLAQLWTHESLRIYEDRLGDAGRHKFRELLAKLLPSHFGVELSLSGQGPVFGVHKDSLRYQNFDDQEMNPAQAFQEAINEHNALLEPGNRLPFVPFAQMLQHTLRICRVLALRGSRLAVLLGPNNSGRRSACQAACCFFEADCCDVLKSIRSKGTAKEDYMASMRDCIMSAGKLGRRQLVFIRDTPDAAVNEETMDMILDSWHRFLRHGDLLNPEDLQEAALPEASWRPLLFCALSVTSLKFLRHFPGFLAEAYIDSFLPFSEEALQGVISAVTGIDRDLSDKNSKLGARQIAEVLTLDEDHLHFVNTNDAFCHKILAALDLFPQIFRMAPEVSGASLRNFLDMLNTFVVSSTADIMKCRAQRERMIRQHHVVTQVIEVVDESLGPLKEWIDKRRTLNAEVSELQTRLAEIQEEVKKKEAEVEKDEAEKHRTEAAVKVSSQMVALKTARIRDAKEHYQMKMSVLAGVLHPDTLQELSSYQKESAMVSQLVRCLCALVGLDSLPLDGSLSSRLTSVDPSVVTKDLVERMEDIQMGEELEDFSRAARVAVEDLMAYFEALCSLQRALQRDGKAEEVLFEEEERLAEAKAHLTLARDALRDLQQDMSEVKLTLQQSRKDLAEAEDVLYDNHEVVSRAERYYLPAQSAIQAWEAERHDLDLRFDGIPARSAMLAATLSFLGPLDHAERQTWLSRLSELLAASSCVASLVTCPVPLSSCAELEAELATEATRRSWRHQGLVEQHLLSAAMTKVVMDWPFILDPQMQARRWLLAELGREMPLLEVKASDPDLDQKIQRGIAAESAIVVKDCGALAPRLEMRPRPKRTAGGLFGEPPPPQSAATVAPSGASGNSPRMNRRLSRKISTAQLSTSSLKDPDPSKMRSFQIYMISSLSSHRELPPVTLQHCSVVNFALDLEALTQVFEDVLLKSQVPAFEQEFTRLYTMQMDDSALQKAEDRLLQFLDNHRGASILEGEETLLVLSLYQDAQKQREAFHSKFRKDLEDFRRVQTRLKLFALPWALATQSAMVLSTLADGFYNPSIPQISTKLQQIMTGNLVSKVAEAGRHEKEPAFALRKALLLEVLRLLAQPMEEVHRLPLVFLTAVGLARADGALTEHQLQIFWEGHKAVESVASAMNAEIQRDMASGSGQVPQLINPRFIKSSPDRKTFPGEKWELINFLPHVFPGFHGLPQDLMVNIAQWRQALGRPPTGELFFACGHFPEPWQRYRREVDYTSDGSDGSEHSEGSEDQPEEEEEQKAEKIQTMSIPTRGKDMNYDGLTCFEQLMLLKVLQPESVIHAIHGFVAEVLDTSLLEIQPQPILKAMEELQEKDGKFRALLVRCDDSLGSQCPSINEELKVLVEQRKATKDGRRAHVSRCSPLQDIQHVREAALEGAFVLITEMHLASKDFLADLEMLMEELCLGATKEGATAHGGTVLGQGEASAGHSHHAPSMFRLVLCTNTSGLPPLAVVEMCQKVAMFPPIGVKGRLRQLALGSNAWERLKVQEPHDLTPWYRTLFSLCLFHAVLGERYHRYQCCFQSTAYDIAAHWSFKCAVQFFDKETHSQELISHPPWEAMMHWIRTTTHGGHLGDPWHRQRIFALIERFLGPSSESLRNALRDECFDDNEEMSELQIQRARSLRQYLDFQLPRSDESSHPLLGKEAAARCLEALPPAPAELFGLHAREDRVFDTSRSHQMLQVLAKIRPPSEVAASAAEKQHLKVDEMLSELPRPGEKLREELLKPAKVRSRRSIERSNQQDPFGGDPPIAQVLRQELSSLLQLVSFLHCDLLLLRDLLVGQLDLSSEMAEVLRCISSNTVPSRWRRRSFPSCRPLQGWFIGLKLRMQWLQAAWSQRGHEPLCHRLDFYWRPRQLLLSYLRMAAQNDNMALEAYSFRHKVLERIEEEEDVQDRPATGLYCVGIFLYGAGWDRKKSIMADCRPDELFYRMPVIHFIPTADFKPNLEKTYAVPFYQAERQSHMTSDGEDGNYITEVLLRSHRSPKEWLLRSVALYCELA